MQGLNWILRTDNHRNLLGVLAVGSVANNTGAFWVLAMRPDLNWNAQTLLILETLIVSLLFGGAGAAVILANRHQPERLWKRETNVTPPTTTPVDTATVSPYVIEQRTRGQRASERTPLRTMMLFCTSNAASGCWSWGDGVDISNGGASFMTSDEVSRGTTVAVIIPRVGTDGKETMNPMRREALVVEATKNDATHIYRVGLRFMDKAA
jgi:hypothetical protein